MLRQLLPREEAARLPPHPSPRVIRDLVLRRLRAGPLTVGEQMSAVVLITRHAARETRCWELVLRDRSAHVSTRCAALKALMDLAAASGGQPRLDMLTDDDLESLVEPRMMYDGIAHLADGQFPVQSFAVLRTLPDHERPQYWNQAERCRLRAMIGAGLMWGLMLCSPHLTSLWERSLEAIDAEPGPGAAVRLSQLLQYIHGSTLAPQLTRAAKLVAGRIPAADAAPRRLDGLRRLDVTAYEVTSDGATDTRFRLSIRHPESVWIVGSLGTVEKKGTEVDQLDVSTTPPEMSEASFSPGTHVVAVPAERVYDALLSRCGAAQRDGVPIGYAPLLVLSMFEGPVASDRSNVGSELS